MLGDDRISSATVLAGRAEALLRQARSRGPAALGEAVRQVCAAQPCMASLWNLGAAALEPDPAAFERLAARARRAPGLVARHASTILKEDARRIITCSRSAAVEACVRELGVAAVCAESRPGLEGRALAEALAEVGVAVTVTADAAIASDFRRGDVVLVGADALASDWFINKTGTGQLCAAAELAGIPAYVVAGRDKCAGPVIAPLLRLRHDDPATLWPDAPAGIEIRNPLFERVPLGRVGGVITDAGLLAGDMIRAACEAVIPASASQALVDLLKRG
jgi:translation initiation factor 2B subunit (eIF-2B alpha/beta/delta family)